MSYYGGINLAGDARRAHLALVAGTGSGMENTESTRGAAAVLHVVPAAPALASNDLARTGYGAARTEDVRSRHEDGVRSVARNSPNFEAALMPMVLASGVTNDQAQAIYDAILGNPVLRAQAERAFQRSRLDSV